MPATADAREAALAVMTEALHFDRDHAEDALDALVWSNEVRRALETALCPCSPTHAFHDGDVCGARFVRRVLGALEERTDA